MEEMDLSEATVKALQGKLVEDEEENIEGQYSFDDLEKGTFIYETTFRLEYPVNDEEAASEYLLEDDMITYLWSDDRYNITKDMVTKVEWLLEDDQSGIIRVYAKRELTDEELDQISKWISGQNSDGLGEGFEQQDFAESYFNPETGDGPYTRREMEREIENLYDSIDTDTLIRHGYLSDAIWEAVEVYKDENGSFDSDGEDMSDDEIYDLIESDPEEYLDYDVIEDARQSYADGDPQFNENDWYCMASFDWKTNKYKLHLVK